MGGTPGQHLARRHPLEIDDHRLARAGARAATPEDQQPPARPLTRLRAGDGVFLPRWRGARGDERDRAAEPRAFGHEMVRAWPVRRLLLAAETQVEFMLCLATAGPPGHQRDRIDTAHAGHHPAGGADIHVIARGRA